LIDWLIESTGGLHEISDEILGDVMKAWLLALVKSDLLILPHFAGAETSRAMVNLAVCRSKQRLVDARLGGDGVVATSGWTSRHWAQPVRTVLALHRDRRRAPLHIVTHIMHLEKICLSPWYLCWWHTKQSKSDRVVRKNEIITLLRLIPCHMGSQSVTCHPAAVAFLPLPQPKLVLDLATQRNVRLSWPWWCLYPKIVYLRNTVTYLRNNRVVSWVKI